MIHRQGSDGEIRACDDVVAVEEPLEIRVEGQSVAVVMRTPGEDRELAAGFLMTEGVIRHSRDLLDLTMCDDIGTGNTIDAELSRRVAFDPTKFSRHIITSSSCGLCGKLSIDSVLKKRRPLHDEAVFEARKIASLSRRLASEQSGFKATGGLHACALFGADGKMLAMREDVGRHNALDKLIGWALLKDLLPLSGHMVLLSGRASFEMLQKAHAGGIPAVIAIGAPSSLAIDFARVSGQVLCGFVRARTMNVYAGHERVVQSAAVSVASR